MSEKALIAMSGGVDSSVAALLAARAGYECFGVTMKLFENEDVGISKERPCCSLADASDAARAAAAIGIPHYIFDFSEDFRREVIGRFVEAYSSGETPNPCIDCNSYIKYGSLYDRLRKMGFDYLVTGHYADIRREDDGLFHMFRARDRKKDQTYFLYSMTQEQLSHTLFPLGPYIKDETREEAAAAGLATAEKPESQDICFVSGGYADFIEGYGGRAFADGDFVDGEGKVLGRHKGIIRYTIGQRKGLGIALGAPMFVSEIRANAGEVVLTENERDLFACRVGISGLTAVSGSFPAAGSIVEVMIRYGAKPARAQLISVYGDSAELFFENPQRAPAKGQAAVMYDGDELIGGGRITWTKK
ncbi:MAG: tRNA 2-thiouridine(34) synthase MnmA [Clostridiales Family XIII bacterium]|jgi:tRNA-specific 2-thiouridylase|nr:tRNA 2-thiouridine(34) synthase MnmA [Clostridiales Family XIII bacterium]